MLPSLRMSSGILRQERKSKRWVTSKGDKSQGAGGVAHDCWGELTRWIGERGNFLQRGGLYPVIPPVQLPQQLKTLDDLLAQAEHYANDSMRNIGRVPLRLFLIGAGRCEQIADGRGELHFLIACLCPISRAYSPSCQLVGTRLNG